MWIESYLALFALLVIALVLHDRRFQRNRREDRALELSIRRQIEEDTCDRHGQFCCPSCFEM